MDWEDIIMHITDRLYNKKWGIFNHYLNFETEDGDPDWNIRIDGIDTEKIAHTLNKMGAGYYFITIMQGTKYLIAPNKTYEDIMGVENGIITPKRDVILDLYKSLSKYGIDLYLYFTGDGPHNDKIGKQRFGFSYDPNDIWPGGCSKAVPLTGDKAVSREFVEKWASVLREYAERYKDKVCGWWVDGCYSFFGYNDELLKIYYDAIKAGNPNAVTAFNTGVFPETKKWFKDEEFTAGEFNDFTYIPTERFNDGAQNHILAPLGRKEPPVHSNGWAYIGAKRSHEYMKNYISEVNKNGGVVTVDIKVYADGSFDPEQAEIMTLKE